MGLLDVLNGMQNQSRTQGTPASSSKSGGMSPMTKALLGLIAYKAMHRSTGDQASAGTKTGGQSPSAPSGGLADALKGGLGGLLAGGAAGTVVSGGLNDLLKQLQQNGQGDVAQSWIGKGPNKQISPNDLAAALGADQINTLASFSGMSRDDMLNGLSQQLPDVIDQLTPDGRVPTEQEAARFV
jgi:uncharacterized protein YidB (DUF937 family)